MTHKQMRDKQMWDKQMAQKYASISYVQVTHADHVREGASRSAYGNRRIRDTRILPHGVREYHTLSLCLWTLSLMPIDLHIWHLRIMWAWDLHPIATPYCIWLRRFFNLKSRFDVLVLSVSFATFPGKETTEIAIGDEDWMTLQMQ